jgi:sugar phosphate permease
MGGIVARLAASRVHYGWVAVAVTFLTLVIAAGIRSSAGVLIVPLETEFGWSRATVSFPIALGLLLYGLVGPFSAGMMDRIGVRATMLWALALMFVGYSLTPFIQSSWQLVPLWGLAVGPGTGMAAMVMGAIVANRWFVKRRGLAMGLLTGSTAGGQLLFLPLLGNIVEHHGWRPAVAVGCGVLLCIVPIVLLLMRERPADVGLRPYGLPADQPDPAPISGTNPVTAAFAALGQGIGSRDFWLLSASFFVCGASTLGLMGTHFIPACLDHGIPEATAAGLMAGMGIFNFLGTTGSGWLSDRFDNRYLLFWYYALRGLSLLFLPYAFDFSLWGLSAFGLFYGLDWVATVPPTVRLAANAFGTRNAGMMFGWITVTHQVGSAMAAYGAGLLRTVVGDYAGAFVVSGLLCFVAAVIVLQIGRRPREQAAPRREFVPAEA